MQLHSGNEAVSSELPVVDPPRLIGPVRSFFADLTVSGVSKHFDFRARKYRASQWFASCLFAFLASCFVTAVCDRLVVVGATGVIAFVATHLLFLGSRPRPTTTFVGARGIARVHHGAGRAQRMETLAFEDIDHLSVQRFLRTTGRNARALFAYRFRDARDRNLFEIAGGYFLDDAGESKTGPDNAIFYAEAAEAAWVEFRVERLLSRLEQGEDIVFRAAGREAITIRRGDVEIRPAGGGLARGAVTEIEGPIVRGALVHFTLPSESANTLTDNPFQPPRALRECKFDGAELRDLAVLTGLIETIRSGNVNGETRIEPRKSREVPMRQTFAL